MATTFMDTDKMKNVANGFEGVSNVLKAVSMALQAAMVALKVASFISFGATAWMERWVSNIQPKVENLGKKTGEISNDIEKAIANHQAASRAGESFS